ncbi:MAG: DNA-binding transcriptional LysR family regulator [Limisphaerales bacterium]|jgi:DNA-binding transcriptional LysR family regulator
MDTELLRTFLEVRRTRHFARAAQNLYLTQAAVSARINQLEGLMGQKLFTRGRNNIQLTTAGTQLVPYAETILAAWSRAILETAFRDEQRTLVTVGCLPSLREIYLDAWLQKLLFPARNWLLQVMSINTFGMINLIRDSTIGIGILYEPPRASDLWTERLTTFDLSLVATRSTLDLSEPLPGYIYVDWGSSFEVAHNTQLAGIATPTLKVDTPILARQLLLQLGGSAYLAGPMISKDLEEARLHAVHGAPTILRDVYLIGRKDMEGDETINQVRDSLREIAIS